MTNPVNAQDLLELIEGYKSYEADCRQSDTLIDISRANLYKTIRHDLEALLPTPPRRWLSDMYADEVSALVGQQVKVAGHHSGKLLAFDEDSCALLVGKDDTESGWPEVEVVARVLAYPLPAEGEGVNGPFPDPEGMTTQDPHTGEWEPYRHILNTPEPQPGECWLIDVAGTERESIKLSHTNMCWLTVDDDGLSVTYMETEITVLHRLVPGVDRG